MVERTSTTSVSVCRPKNGRHQNGSAQAAGEHQLCSYAALILAAVFSYVYLFGWNVSQRVLQRCPRCPISLDRNQPGMEPDDYFGEKFDGTTRPNNGTMTSCGIQDPMNKSSQRPLEELVFDSHRNSSTPPVDSTKALRLACLRACLRADQPAVAWRAACRPRTWRRANAHRPRRRRSR